MIYRTDLLERFDWLSGSKYLDEALDEAVVAIAFAAHGYRSELVEFGAAWVWVDYTIRYFELEDFVERARAELIIEPRGTD
jgi:hypothetical protein